MLLILEQRVIEWWTLGPPLLWERGWGDGSRAKRASRFGVPSSGGLRPPPSPGGRRGARASTSWRSEAWVYCAGCASARAPAFARTAAPKRRRRSVSDSTPPSAMAAPAGQPDERHQRLPVKARRHGVVGRGVADRDIDLAKMKRRQARLGGAHLPRGELAARGLKLKRPLRRHRARSPTRAFPCSSARPVRRPN